MDGDVGRDLMGVDPPRQVKSLSLVLKVTGVLNRDTSVIRPMFYSHRSGKCVREGLRPNRGKTVKSVVVLPGFAGSCFLIGLAVSLGWFCS